MLTEQAVPRKAARPESPLAATRGAPTPSPRVRGRVRLLVVDEAGLMRDGLCTLLAGPPDFEIAGVASIGLEAVRVAVDLQPHVVIIDFPATPVQGPGLIASLKSELPDLGVIVLTFRKEEHLIEAALRAGADGYVLKSDSREDLFGAVVSVAAGLGFVSPSIQGRAVRSYLGLPQKERERTEPQLTEREHQVIRLIAAGHRTREIAHLLSLSHKTIEKHRTTLMRKLGLRNASAVAAYAAAHGLAED